MLSGDDFAPLGIHHRLRHIGSTVLLLGGDIVSRDVGGTSAPADSGMISASHCAVGTTGRSGRRDRGGGVSCGGQLLCRRRGPTEMERRRWRV